MILVFFYSVSKLLREERTMEGMDEGRKEGERETNSTKGIQMNVSVQDGHDHIVKSKYLFNLCESRIIQGRYIINVL